MPIFDSEAIAELTRSHFPALAAADISVAEMAQDGSDRAYWRIVARHLSGEPPADTMVLMRYGTERAENCSFAPLTRFLRERGVSCPQLLHEDAARHLLWIQDLGDRDLWSFRKEPWEPTRRSLYQSAIREVARIHQVTEETFSGLPGASTNHLQPPFDEKIYQWEQDYFFDNFAANFSDADPAAVREIRRHPALRALVTGLSSLPRTLVHRDFQSRNILVRENRAYLIDYQGMRFGRPEYDLASLLFDPYVQLSPEQRDEMLAFYSGLGDDLPSGEKLRENFLRCAASRLMQALGAYGFLGLRKQKRHFLDSIPQAAKNLKEIAAQIPELGSLRPLLDLKSIPSGA